MSDAKVLTLKDLPTDNLISAVKMGNATVHVVIAKGEVKALKAHAGSISSYSPTAFKLSKCPTPQADGSVLEVVVPLVLRTMNNKVPKDANKAIEGDNVI